MILAEATSTTTVLDPTLQVLLTIFGGALVAALAGLVGAGIQHRREQSRWLRERRYEAYVSLMTHISALRAASGRLEANKAALSEAEDVSDDLATESKNIGQELARLVSESHEVHARAKLLGTVKFKSVVAGIPDTWTDSASHDRIVVALETATRRDLGVKDS